MRRLVFFLGAFSLLLIVLTAASAELVQTGMFRGDLHSGIAWAAVPATIVYVVLSLRELARTPSG